MSLLSNSHHPSYGSSSNESNESKSAATAAVVPASASSSSTAPIRPTPRWDNLRKVIHKSKEMKHSSTSSLTGGSPHPPTATTTTTTTTPTTLTFDPCLSHRSVRRVGVRRGDDRKLSSDADKLDDVDSLEEDDDADEETDVFHPSRRFSPTVTENQVELAHQPGTIWNAVRRASIEEMEELIAEEGPSVLWKRDTLHARPLHMCFVYGSPAHHVMADHIMERYPELVCDQYEGTEYTGETILHIAIVNQQEAIVRNLLSINKNLLTLRAVGNFFQQGQPCYYGEYPLFFAACTNQPNMVRMLLEAGADLNEEDSNGNSILHLCVVHTLPAMYAYLKSEWLTRYGSLPVEERPPELWRRTNLGRHTPITLAAKLGNETMFAFLLEEDKRIQWSYGAVSCVLLPLEGLDLPLDADQNAPSVIYGTQAPEDIRPSERRERKNRMEGRRTSNILTTPTTTPTTSSTTPAPPSASSTSTSASTSAERLTDRTHLLASSSPRRSSYHSNSSRPSASSVTLDVPASSSNLSSASASSSSSSQETNSNPNNSSSVDILDSDSDHSNPDSSSASSSTRNLHHKHRSPSVLQRGDGALELIVQYAHLNLLMHPRVLELIDKKWDKFASRIFWKRFIISIIYLTIFTVGTIWRTTVHSHGKHLLTRAQSHTGEHLNQQPYQPPQQQVTGGSIDTITMSTSTNLTQMASHTFTMMEYDPIGMFEHFDLFLFDLFFSPLTWSEVFSAHATIQYIGELIVVIGAMAKGWWELSEMRKFGWRTYCNTTGSALFENILSLTFCICIFIVLLLTSLNSPMERAVMAIACITVWCYCFFYLLAFRLTGPMVVMIFRMLTSDVLRFVMVYLVFLMGFALAFFVLFDEDGGGGFMQSFASCFLITLGDFDVNTYTELPYWWLAITFLVMFIIVVTILLLNMLIAMMADTYQDIVAMADKQWHLERARIIFAIEHDLTQEERQRPENRYWVTVEGKRYLQVKVVDPDHFRNNRKKIDTNGANLSPSNTVQLQQPSQLQPASTPIPASASTTILSPTSTLAAPTMVEPSTTPTIQSS